jgi:hypothetical protein
MMAGCDDCDCCDGNYNDSDWYDGDGDGVGDGN